MKAVLDGTWKTGDTWDGIKEGTVVLSPWSKKLPPTWSSSPRRRATASPPARVHPFTGPINKQDGSPWLKAGEKASDKDLSSMNFYVQGVEGSLPK